MTREQLLREKMDEKRYSGRKLAADVGMKQSTFSSRMTGRTSWNIYECVRIAKVLNIKDSEIVKYFG